MKRTPFLLMTVAAAAQLAAAGPCILTTLSAYIAQGATGCTVGSDTVFGFQELSGQTGAIQIPVTDITVAPSGDSLTSSLQFSTTQTVNSPVLEEALLTYRITGSTFLGVMQTLAGTSSSGNGAVTSVQNYCPNGVFGANGVTGCPADPGGTINVLVNVGSGSASATFTAPTTSLSVTDDFVLDASGGGSASGGMLTDKFSSASSVPEPNTYLLSGFAVILMLALNSRRQRSRIRAEVTVYRARAISCGIMVALLVAPLSVFAASHREAPITALDHKADITDLFAFVSYDDPTKVTLILNVDPLLEPGNGPNYFPFDDNVLYTINVDNTNSAAANVQFVFQFTTHIANPGLFTGFVGAGSGINAPANSPAPVAPGTPIVPPAITALSGPGAAGLNLSQTYTVRMIRNGVATTLGSGTLYAVPSNAGPRTMPNYTDLAKQGIYNLGNGIRVFAGTVDDPFYIDLGAAFDSLNFRAGAGGGVLTAAQDADDNTNTAPDFVSGYNVNTIAVEVPVAMLTRTGTQVAASDSAATIGVWGATYRPRISVRRAPFPAANSGGYAQIQRMGNPLINELIIGTGYKDFWSMSPPVNDYQFADFDLDPLLARVLNAVYGIDIPAPPRTDLLPLVTYAPPIAAPGTPAGPVADLLRLNTGVPPAPMASRRRLGVLAGDLAGFPNGRRVSDDVTDIAARAVAGILCGVTATCQDAKGTAFLGSGVPRIGDGVNTNDLPYQETFPYVAFAQSGRNRRHSDPGEAGCTMNAGAPCPIN